jgi:hypothetical protein
LILGVETGWIRGVRCVLSPVAILPFAMNKERSVRTPSVVAAVLVLSALACWWLWPRERYELPWDLWREIRAAAEASPDHLEASAERVVAQGEARAIFEFVRDAIRTVPDRDASGDAGLRWGVRGVLRSGAGTHLEKSMLLSDLLRRAGHEVELVRIQPVAAVPAPSAVPPVVAREFESGIPVETLRARLGPASSLGTEDLPSVSPRIADLVPDGLAESLASEMRIRSGRPMRALHAVRLRTEDGFRVLVPGLAGSEFGVEVAERHLRVEDVDALLAVRPRVVVRMSAAYDDSSYTPFTVVEAGWPLDDVVGRTIRLSYKLLGPPELLLQARVSDFESFVPSVDVLSAGEQDRPEFHVTGDVLTTGGRVVPREQVAQLGLDELVLASAEANDAQAIALGRVLAADFPVVRVEAEVKDAAGDPLMGLGADDFQLEIGGRPVTHRMVINQSMPPRVLFLYDDSTSMPSGYQDRTRTQALLEAAIRAAHEANPDTLFRVAAFGDAYSKMQYPSAWSRDPGFLTAHVAEHRSGRSNNWSALVGGVSSEADIVVLVTDADGTEKPSDYEQRRIEEGVPALVFGVESNQTRPGEFEAMAQWSRGAHFLVEREEAAALDELRRRVGATRNHRYLLEAVVAGDEAPELELELRVGGGDDAKAASTTFAVPPAGARSPTGKNAITGLYLEVEYDGRIHRTTLAGVPHGSNERSHPITRETIDACNNALFGEYRLHVEAGPPTRGVALADRAVRLLGLREVERLLEEKDPVRFFADLQKLYWAPDLPDLAGLVGAGEAEDGLHVWLHALQPDAAGAIEESLVRLETSAPFGRDGTDLDAAESLRQAHVREDAARRALRLASSTASAENVAISASLGQGRDGRLAVPRVQRTPALDLVEAAAARNRRVDTAARIFLLPEGDDARGFVRLDPVEGSVHLRDARGNTATRPTGERLDRGARLLDTPFGWRATLGMRMETWSDLEGGKLAYIQVGTVAMKGLGAHESPGTIMRAVQDRLRAWARAELAVAASGDGGTDDFRALLEIARLNLSNFQPPKP